MSVCYELAKGFRSGHGNIHNLNAAERGNRIGNYNDDGNYFRCYKQQAFPEFKLGWKTLQMLKSSRSFAESQLGRRILKPSTFGVLWLGLLVSHAVVCRFADKASRNQRDPDRYVSVLWAKSIPWIVAATKFSYTIIEFSRGQRLKSLTCWTFMLVKSSEVLNLPRWPNHLSFLMNSITVRVAQAACFVLGDRMDRVDVTVAVVPDLLGLKI